MKVVYIAGPYRANTLHGIRLNIRRAEEAAIGIWQMGCVALCPHKNTALFDGLADDSIWLRGGLELLRRCDALLVLPNSENSKGTQAEIELAGELGIPVYYSMSSLRSADEL